MVRIIILFVIAYLLGSIPSGVWIGKFFYKIDIREHGSGNSGTTNAFRVLGPRPGIAVFLMDMLKGSLATWLPMWLGIPLHPIWFGLAAILGHVFPLFAKFKGGKAVATAAGIAFAMYPLFLISMLAVWGGVLYLSSMVSLASLTAIFAALIFSLFLQDWIFTLVVLIVFILVVYRHKDNLKRIKSGIENKVPWGLRKDK